MGKYRWLLFLHSSYHFVSVKGNICGNNGSTVIFDKVISKMFSVSVQTTIHIFVYMFIKFAADQPVNAYATNLHRAYVRASMCAYITFQDS